MDESQDIQFHNSWKQIDVPSKLLRVALGNVTVPKQIILMTLAVCWILLASLMLVTFVCIGTSFTAQNNFSKKNKPKQNQEKKNQNEKSIFIIAKKYYAIIFAPKEFLAIFNISKSKKKMQTLKV